MSKRDVAPTGMIRVLRNASYVNHAAFDKALCFAYSEVSTRANCRALCDLSVIKPAQTPPGTLTSPPKCLNDTHCAWSIAAAWTFTS